MRVLLALACLLALLSCAARSGADFEHLSARVRALVVRIESGETGKELAASGFFVNEGRVVTLSGAVPHEGEIRLRAPDGSWTLSRVIARDEANDLALLEPVPPPSAPASPLKFATALPRPGASVLLAGYPGEYGLSVLVTTVTATGVPLEDDPAEELLLLQSKSREGLGGAPVLNGAGEIVGIVRGGDGEFTSALSAAVLSGALGELMAGEPAAGASWKALGLGVREVLEVRALRVESVSAEGAAARAGLLVGDLIVGIGGRRAASLDFAQSLLGGWRSDRAIPLVIQRDLKQVRLHLTPAR